MAYSKSNGHVIDGFSSSRDLRDVKVVTQYVWGSSLLPCSYQTSALSSSPTPSFLSFLPPTPFTPLPFLLLPFTSFAPLSSSATTSFLSCPFPPSLPLTSSFPLPSFHTPFLSPFPSHLSYPFLLRYPFLPPPIIFSSSPLSFFPVPSLLIYSLTPSLTLPFSPPLSSCTTPLVITCPYFLPSIPFSPTISFLPSFLLFSLPVLPTSPT